MDGPGPYRAIRDLLLVNRPRTRTSSRDEPLCHVDEPASEAAVRLAADLDQGVLAIQGPPGSGKTRTAAAIIVALVGQNKTVGITANSHAVISHLLEGIVHEAERQGVALRASQKSDGDQGLVHPAVAQRDNAQIRDDLDQGVKVVAGTSWLFSRPEFDQAIDYLVVDEAGQMSLANVAAVGTCARNLILVGDPSQLAQPSKGTHPDGVDVSALDHLLDGSVTLRPDLGIFLDVTYRLHPQICEFISEIVYGGRLHPAPGCERQFIEGDGPVSGAGLRWLPVEHAGDRTSSRAEADAVRQVYDGLLGQVFVDRDGARRVMGTRDILVVAPYNAQVSLLQRVLPADARVGTVDKFQGQEAPAVIVSLATSSLDDIPRGMEFLYSRNRLNVAVSRAKALSVLVGSPELLSVKCNTVEQLRLANGLCRFAELAAP